MIAGMRCGNYVGQVNATAMFAAIDPDETRKRVLTWTPRRSGARYHVIADTEEQGTTLDAEWANILQTARDHIQIIETPTHNVDEDLSRVADSPLDTVRLAWTEVAGIPALYRLYQSTQSGNYASAPIATYRAGQTAYAHKAKDLDDGTYYWRVSSVDAAGNVANSNEVTKTISAAPNPPSGIAISESGGTVALAWTASTSGDILHYNIYRGTSTVEIFDAGPYAEDVASPWSEDMTGQTGHWEYLVRAEDVDNNEEANLSQMVAVDLVNGARVARPNAPIIVKSEAIASGQVRLTVQYDAKGEVGEATSVRLYVNNGAGGAIDYNTSVGSATLTSDARFEATTISSTGLTGGLTYRCGARARTDSGYDDLNTAYVDVLTDSTAPTAPTLSATIV